MSQLQEYLKILQNWKEQTGRKIYGALVETDKITSFKQAMLEPTFKTITTFHRQIMKADESLVDVKWFQFCIRLKAKLKKKIQEAEKQRQIQLQREKKEKSALIVEYPADLTSGKGPTDEKLLKFLFKSFVTNFQQSMADSRTVEFLRLTLKQIKHKFDDKPNESACINKRVTSIANRLTRESSSESKGRMLNGQITPKALSSDDEELYFDERTRENIRRIQMEVVQRSRTDFYDDMKRKINKDACEACPHCSQNAAYCEDQQQIRASDQPMTRFMRCNACDRTWTD